MRRFLLAASLPLLLLSVCGCSHEKKAEPPAAAATPPAAPPAESPQATSDNAIVVLEKGSPQLAKLTIEPVQTMSVAVDEVIAPGNLETNPNRVAHAVLPVPGRIVAVFAHVGDSVKEGQPLLSIESPEVDAAELAYRQAETTLAQAKAAEAKAQSDFDRLSDLFAHQAVAKKEVIAAESQLTQVKASVNQAEAGRLQTIRRFEILGLKPGSFGQKVTVRSPITGKVLTMGIAAGEFHNDLSDPLMTIADLRSLWVSSNVPESYIRHCKVGGSVQVELVAFPGEIFRGRVSHIADTVDAETRTTRVRSDLDNSSGRFRPEMFGKIKYGEVKEALPAVAETAVLQYDGKPAVYVEEQPGRFVRRFIVVDRRVDNKIIVRTGLAAGDRLVTAGSIYLKGGI